MSLSQFSFALSLSVFFLLFNAFMKGLGFRLYEPGRIFLLPWLLGSFLLLFGPVHYLDRFSISTLFIVVLYTVAYLSGAVLSKHRKFNVNSGDDLAIGEPSTISKWLLLVLSGVYLAATIIDIYTSGFFNLLLAERRLEHWDSLYYQEKSSVAIVTSFTKVGAILYLISISKNVKRRRYRSVLFSCILMFVFIVDSLFLSAGRFEIIFILLGMIIYAAVTKAVSFSKILKSPAFVSVFALIAIYIFLIFPSQRNPDLLGNEQQYLSKISDAEFSSTVVYLSDEVGMTYAKSFAYNLGYFSEPIHKLDFFIRNSDIASWGYMGEYNFVFFKRAWTAVFGGATEWVGVRLRIADILSGYGLSINPWSTGYRDVIIDFGYIGSFVFILFLGYVSQASFNRADKTKSYEDTNLAVMFSAGMFVFPLLSPFFIDSFLFTLVFSMIMSLVFTRKIRITSFANRI
jgi:oligosaccharide repeat unit polymerase